MVSLEAIRASNATLKNLKPGLVAVFVGATSGIGEATLRALVKNTNSPKVYIVGRNEEAATRIADEARKLNEASTINFIKSDASLLRNVDDACNQIKAKEDRINLLFMTPGYLTLSGRNETSEGIDRKFALNYYSRIRFAHNLLPLLTAASSSTTTPSLSRVVSVLAPGREGPLNLSDLSLEKTFSLRNCEAHSVTMKDLMFEELAARHPETSFVHSFPGAVKTPMGRNSGGVTGTLLQGLISVIGGLLTSPEESGERHLYAATAGVFPARVQGKDGDGLAVGSDGEGGSGAYLIGSKSDRAGKESILRQMRELGAKEKVWEHTLDVFKKVEG